MDAKNKEGRKRRAWGSMRQKLVPKRVIEERSGEADTFKARRKFFKRQVKEGLGSK